MSPRDRRIESESSPNVDTNPFEHMIPDLWTAEIVKELNQRPMWWASDYVPPKLSLRTKVRLHIERQRERLAYKIAPWVDREPEW